MSACECHQIGGPFIGADPRCPVHGEGSDVRDRLRAEADLTEDPDELRELMDKILETLYG